MGLLSEQVRSVRETSKIVTRKLFFGLFELDRDEGRALLHASARDAPLEWLCAGGVFVLEAVHLGRIDGVNLLSGEDLFLSLTSLESHAELLGLNSSFALVYSDDCLGVLVLQAHCLRCLSDHAPLTDQLDE